MGWAEITPRSGRVASRDVRATAAKVGPGETFLVEGHVAEPAVPANSGDRSSQFGHKGV
jgi:hypothetical protein